MTKRTENWWVRVRDWNGEAGILQLAEVEFDGDAPCHVGFMATTACLYPDEMDQLTLVEPVLPPGRVQAVIEKLEDALGDQECSTPMRMIGEAIDLLQGEAPVSDEEVATGDPGGRGGVRLHVYKIGGDHGSR